MMDENVAKALAMKSGIHRVQGVSWQWVVEELQTSLQDPGPEERLIVKDLLGKLSGEARRIVEFLLEYPDEFRAWSILLSRQSECAHRSCLKCRLLQRYLMETFGWSKLTVERAFRQIRKKLTLEKRSVFH